MKCFDGLFSKKKDKKVEQVQSTQRIQQVQIANITLNKGAIEIKQQQQQQKIQKQTNNNKNFLTPSYTPSYNKSSSLGSQYPQKDPNQQFVNTAGKVGKSHHNYFKQLQKKSSTSTYRGISKQQLATHTKANDAWLSLQGIVYDVTVYMRHHPGGNIILQGCGRQCMHLFNQYHHWVNYKYLLDKYKIGFLQH